jgi:large subunit ribosomal protein L28
MAKCAHCGKTTSFGRNRPWSNKATRRTFRPNLQRVTIYEDGKKVQVLLCAKCIKTMAKTV